MPAQSAELRTKPYRIALLVGIVCIIPLGYGVRFSSALNAPLLQDIAGAVCYQMLWMMIVAFIRPKLSLAKCAVGVFIASSAIEFLQLCKLPFLLALRATWLGRVILGTTFLWADFPPYALGCVFGWVTLSALRKRFTRPLAATGR